MPYRQVYVDELAALVRRWRRRGFLGRSSASSLLVSRSEDTRSSPARPGSDRPPPPRYWKPAPLTSTTSGVTLRTAPPHSCSTPSRLRTLRQLAPTASSYVTGFIW